MSNLNSDKITIFPSARRYNKPQQARLFTESNVVRIVNRLIDSDGFVISQSLNNNEPFEFNIYGYFIHINQLSDITSLFPNDTIVYASIVLDKTDSSYIELDGQDDNDEYKGVNFTNTQPILTDLLSNGTDSSNYELHYLKILERKYTNDTWSISNEGRIKFDISSVDISIDGGTI